MTQRMNGDLANDLGNLSQRVLSMIFKNCDGMMPALPDILKDEDEQLLQSADGQQKQISDTYKITLGSFLPISILTNGIL